MLYTKGLRMSDRGKTLLKALLVLVLQAITSTVKSSVGVVCLDNFQKISLHIKKVGNGAHKLKAQTARAYPSFLSMKYA